MKINFGNSKYFINPQYSWLEFNNRVLAEALEKDNPLLERIKFLSIVSSNLEEFFMVRVAGVKKHKEAGITEGGSPDLIKPDIELKSIRERVKKLIKNQYVLFYKKLNPILKKQGVEILLNYESLIRYKNFLTEVFEREIKPILTPISVGPTHPFPNLVTGRLYLAVGLSVREETDKKIEKSNLSFIEIPTNIQGRFIKIENHNKFVPIENIIKMFVDQIYNGYDIESAHIIKITRDADFTIDEADETSDLLHELETTIKQMHKRSITKFEYEKGIPPRILNTIIDKNNLKRNDIYQINGLLNFNDLMELYKKIDKPELKDSPLLPIFDSNFSGKNIFEDIKRKDFVLFHPYHSYEPVIELINQAADDAGTLAIKQLLYRTSSNSPIIKALIRAAEKGKYVTAVVELTARFDEKRNIEWTKKLQDAGAHVIYGIAGLKTHAKALMIIRKENNEIKKYMHLATGNYNEITAQIYTDLSFFTCDDSFGEDISSLFNLLTGFSLPTGFNNVSIAPIDLRNKILSMITRETDNAKNGGKARIIAKMNALYDKEIVEALYQASAAGVKIDLIARGICILRPGIKKVSENIKVKSIVGKFLEHARIYYFYNGGNEEYYLSSADLMTRNLDRRVELLFPVKNEQSRKFIQKILKLQLEDSLNSYILQPTGSYKPVLKKTKDNKNYFKALAYINDAKI
nr:polyphosphate kinase 1 [bacterium]